MKCPFRGNIIVSKIQINKNKTYGNNRRKKTSSK